MAKRHKCIKKCIARQSDDWSRTAHWTLIYCANSLLCYTWRSQSRDQNFITLRHACFIRDLEGTLTDRTFLRTSCVISTHHRHPGARGRPVVWGTALQSGRSRVLFAMGDVALTQFFRPQYGAGFYSASSRNEYQGYFVVGKGGRCVALKTLPSSCVDCLEIPGASTS